MINTIVVIDTETTDADPADGAELCEIGMVSVNRVHYDEWALGPGFSTLVETTVKFSPAARGTHHIAPEQCAPGALGCVPRDEIIGGMLRKEKPGSMLYAAHNAEFDKKFLTELTIPFIDTYQCARHIWPDAPKYSNQTLRYYLEAEPPQDLLHNLLPHRALYDAACTGAILLKMLQRHPPEKLLELTKTPILLKTCNFGKHKGKLWSEVPTDYLAWLVRSSDMYQTDKEMKYTVDYYLTKKTSQLPF